MATEETVYFENAGKDNTEATLNIAKKRAKELGIKTIVIASTRGYTASKAVDILQGLKMVAVGHCCGSFEPNQQQFTPENRKKVESEGGSIVTAAHAFGGLSGAMRSKYNMYELGDIVADTLRIFSQGVKVACEVTLMATDAGLVQSGEEVIALGGSSNGADTAIVLRGANTHRFFDLHVSRILCKPLG